MVRTKKASALWFDDKLTLHPPMTEPAAIAAMERVGSRDPWDKLHYRGGSLFEFEAIFFRTENEAGRTFLIRSVRVGVDLETMGLIQ